MVLRIFKMIATTAFLTALECTKFVFGIMALNILFCADVSLSDYSLTHSFSAGAPPRTPLGELTSLPQTLYLV